MPTTPHLVRLTVLGLVVMILVVLALCTQPRRASQPPKISLVLGGTAPEASLELLNCTAELASMQAAQFPAHDPMQSACTEHVWLDQFQAQRPHGDHIIIDIGCNKGYHVAESLDLFTPELGVNKHSLRDALGAQQQAAGWPHNALLCGACDVTTRPDGFLLEKESCRQRRSAAQGRPGQLAPRRLELHCVEPSDRNYALLLRTRQMLFGNVSSAPPERGPLTLQRGAASATWHLHNMAVSNFSGTAAFTSACDTELCHLESGPAGGAGGAGGAAAGPGQYMVQVVTVDEVMARWVGAGRRASLLKIDTEGFDPDVLQGARHTLDQQAVDLVVFEYHYLGRWKEQQLADVVPWMAARGYVCYFEGQPFIYKLSRGCWNPKYEIKNWSNVVCGRAGDWPELLLDAHSYLRQLAPRAA